jgi:hypothetical protein
MVEDMKVNLQMRRKKEEELSFRTYYYLDGSRDEKEFKNGKRRKKNLVSVR